MYLAPVLWLTVASRAIWLTSPHRRARRRPRHRRPATDRLGCAEDQVPRPGWRRHARQARRRRREHGCCDGHCCRRQWRQLERRGRDVTLAFHSARPADVRGCCDGCGWRYRRATTDLAVLAAGGGARQARWRRRDHGCCVGHCRRRGWWQLERRGRDVTLAIHGARPADVRGCPLSDYNAPQWAPRGNEGC